MLAHTSVYTASAPATASMGSLTIRQAAKILGLAPSTLHRCLNDGFYRRRAAYSRRTVADPNDRGTESAFCRGGTSRLLAYAKDGVATGQTLRLRSVRAPP